MSKLQQQNDRFPGTKEIKSIVKKAEKFPVLCSFQEVEEILAKYPDPNGSVFLNVAEAIRSRLQAIQDGNCIINNLALVNYLGKSKHHQVRQIWKELAVCVRALKHISKKEILGGDVGVEIRKRACAVEEEVTNFKMVRCPQCRSDVPCKLTQPLGECARCTKSFCTKCLQNYHGMVICSVVEHVEVPSAQAYVISTEYLDDKHGSIARSISLDEQASVATFHGTQLASLVGYSYATSGSRQTSYKPTEPAPKSVVHCPKCHWRCNFDPFTYMGECTSCSLAFCTNCGADYHGFVECGSVYAPEKKVQEEVLATVIADAIPGSSSTSHKEADLMSSEIDSITKPYENAFYNIKAKDDEFYPPDDISACFVSSTGEEQIWPWEQSQRRASLSSTAEYSSLFPGKWVEDEVLEKAMKTLANQIECQSDVCVLESYLLRWGLKRDYEDGAFTSVLQEKDILTKKAILALMNTDVTGSGGHWILGVVDLQAKKIVLYDTSLVISKSYYYKFFFYLLHVIHVACQLMEKKVDATEWQLLVSLDTSQQHNAVDCGPLVVANTYAALQKCQLGRSPSSSQLRQWILNLVTTPTPVQPTETETDISSKAVQTLDTGKVKPFKPEGLTVKFKETKEIHLTL